MMRHNWTQQGCMSIELARDMVDEIFNHGAGMLNNYEYNLCNNIYLSTKTTIPIQLEKRLDTIHRKVMLCYNA